MKTVWLRPLAEVVTMRGIEADIGEAIIGLRRRWRQARALEAVLLALVLGLGWYVAVKATGSAYSPLWGLAPAALALAGIGLWLSLFAPGDMALARRVDRTLLLAERMATATELSEKAGASNTVIEALLADAAASARRIDAGQVVRRLSRLAQLGLAVVVLLAGAALWLSREVPAPPAVEFVPSVPVPEPVAAAPTMEDIATTAERIAEDAEARGDEELAEAAREVQDMAADVDLPEDELANALSSLLDKAQAVYLNPMHNWPPFEGDPALAGRMNDFQQQRKGGGGSGNGGQQGPNVGNQNPAGQTSSGEAAGELPESQDPVRATSLPVSGDEGEGLGIKPPAGQNDGAALGEKDAENANDGAEAVDQTGTAEGAGQGQSNMAGRGEVEIETGAGAALAPAMGQPGETMTLSAAETTQGRSNRTSDTTEAKFTEVEDLAFEGDWAPIDAAPVERQPVPRAAAGVVERYFTRNLEDAEDLAQ